MKAALTASWIFLSSALPGRAEEAGGFEAFRSGLHPLLRARCASCHDSGGKGPPHSLPDARQSYSAIRSYVDFTDAGRSVLVRKVESKHWTDYDPERAEKGMTREELLAVLEPWVRAEREGRGSATPKLVTAELALPADLPDSASGKYVPLRWDLSALGADLAGVVFEVEAQIFSIGGDGARGAYRVRKPRLATASKAISLRGIHVLVNGKPQASASAYSRISNVVSPTAFDARNAILPHPLLSTRQMILLAEPGMRDRLSIGFDDLRAAAPEPCRSAALFRSAVMPVLEARNCFACHSGGVAGAAGAGKARQRFAMARDADSICSQALERLDRASSESSPFLAAPLFGAYQHPPVFARPAPVFRAWMAWVEAETGIARTRDAPASASPPEIPALPVVRTSPAPPTPSPSPPVYGPPEPMPAPLPVAPPAPAAPRRPAPQPVEPEDPEDDPVSWDARWNCHRHSSRDTRCCHVSVQPMGNTGTNPYFINRDGQSRNCRGGKWKIVQGNRGKCHFRDPKRLDGRVWACVSPGR